MGAMGPPMVGMRPPASASVASTPFLDLHSPYFGGMNRPISAVDETVSKLSAKSVLPNPTAVQNGKENRNPSERRMPSLYTFDYPFDSRFPTPHSALQGPVWGSFNKNMQSWDSDTEMRDPSSMFPSLSRAEKEHNPTLSKHSPAPKPASSGIKSRKEGLSVDSPANNPGARHDQSLLPTANNEAPDEVSCGDSVAGQPANNAEAIKASPFAPSHRSGMSSIEKIETKLYSALGEAMGDELNMFPIEDQLIEAGGPTEGNDAESPIMKRKRQGTIGGDRGRSPIAKTMREDFRNPATPMPRLRGGD